MFLDFSRSENIDANPILGGCKIDSPGNRYCLLPTKTAVLVLTRVLSGVRFNIRVETGDGLFHRSCMVYDLNVTPERTPPFWFHSSMGITHFVSAPPLHNGLGGQSYLCTCMT